jgi:hypothetical protein
MKVLPGCAPRPNDRGCKEHNFRRSTAHVLLSAERVFFGRFLRKNAGGNTASGTCSVPR